MPVLLNVAHAHLSAWDGGWGGGGRGQALCRVIDGAGTHRLGLHVGTHPRMRLVGVRLARVGLVTALFVGPWETVRNLTVVDLYEVVFVR